MEYNAHGGLSFVFCGVCGREFLTSTAIAVIVAANPNACNVCDRCGVQGYSCVDCGEYCGDGSGWCEACARHDQAFEEWMFDGSDR